MQDYIYIYIQLVRRYLVFSRNSENTSGVGKSRFFRKLLLRPSLIRSCLRETHLDCSLVFIADFIGSSGRTTADTEEAALARKPFFRKSYNFYLQTLGMFVQVCKTLDLYRSKVLRILRNHAHVNKIGWISMSVTESLITGVFVNMPFFDFNMISLRVSRNRIYPCTGR